MTGTEQGIQTQMPPIVLAALLLLSLLWGYAFFAGAVAVEHVPPLTLTWLRVTIAALVLWFVVCVSKHALPRQPVIWVSFLLMGLINNAIPFSLIFWAQTHVESGVASIFNATTPLFTLALAGVFLPDERFSLAKLLGLIFGVLGVIALVGPQSLDGFSATLLAQIALLAAALSYGFAIVFGRRFRRWGVTPTIVATGQLTGSSLLLLPMILIVDQPWRLANPPASVWLIIIALAIFATAFAYLLYFFILQRSGATNASLVTFLVPGSAILLGAIFLSERLALNHGIGLALILFGLAVIDGRLWVFVKKKLGRA